MKTFLIPAFVLALAAPAFADAEAFGEKMLERNGSNASAATLAMAAEKLSGDMVDEKLPFGENEIATRSNGTISVGHQRLAIEMGVNARDYSVAELAKMYIGEYD